MLSLPQVFDPASTAYAIADCFIAAILGQLLDGVYSTASDGNLESREGGIVAVEDEERRQRRG